MKITKVNLLHVFCTAILTILTANAVQADSSKKPVPTNVTVNFPKGTATPSEVCGECHKSIYREFAFGFGNDIQPREATTHPAGKNITGVGYGMSSTATAHAIAGVDPFPIHAREAEAEGKSCNVCHFPEAFALPNMEISEVYKPNPRAKENEAGGLTCASCHLTPEGKIRGPYNLRAPHQNFPDVQMKTSLMCAYCHSLGGRVVGKQTQTFLEWREDFWKKGLGSQNCQDCHMPRTTRHLAEDYDTQERVVARHLWTGGRSLQRLQNALNQVIVQSDQDAARFEFHIINIGAGHSVPTGSNRRAIYLQVEAVDKKGAIVDRHEWMFAPSYGSRPDDKAFLEQDKKLPDAKAAMQADSQGPHESILRAGEERVLNWSPKLKKGDYTIKSRLVYDLNRYNDKKQVDDQTTFNAKSLQVTVK